MYHSNHADEEVYEFFYLTEAFELLDHAHDIQELGEACIAEAADMKKWYGKGYAKAQELLNKAGKLLAYLNGHS
jgi:hypothetical protein